MLLNNYHFVLLLEISSSHFQHHHADRHTRTSKILFRHVIETIKMFLNLNPDSLPIILSLENHCSIPYQQVMAGNMVDILGDNLFIPDENELNNPLPSPQR